MKTVISIPNENLNELLNILEEELLISEEELIVKESDFHTTVIVQDSDEELEEVLNEIEDRFNS